MRADVAPLSNTNVMTNVLLLLLLLPAGTRARACTEIEYQLLFLLFVLLLMQQVRQQQMLRFQ